MPEDSGPHDPTNHLELERQRCIAALRACADWLETVPSYNLAHALAQVDPLVAQLGECAAATAKRKDP